MAGGWSMKHLHRLIVTSRPTEWLRPGRRGQQVRDPDNL